MQIVQKSITNLLKKLMVRRSGPGSPPAQVLKVRRIASFLSLILPINMRCISYELSIKWSFRHGCSRIAYVYYHFDNSNIPPRQSQAVDINLQGILKISHNTSITRTRNLLNNIKNNLPLHPRMKTITSFCLIKISKKLWFIPYCIDQL